MKSILLLDFLWSTVKRSLPIFNKPERPLSHRIPGNVEIRYCFLVLSLTIKISSWLSPFPWGYCSVFVFLLHLNKAFLKAQKLCFAWSHWRLLTDVLYSLHSHLFSCQESILQGPGRQRVEAFYHSSSRDQSKKDTATTLVSIYKYTNREGRASKWWESMFPLRLNRHTAGRPAKGSATSQFLSFL